ncbi:MAG: efflux RND transporter periplasmic adaptor subunit [Acidobacteriota bacterium]
MPLKTLGKPTRRAATPGVLLTLLTLAACAGGSPPDPSAGAAPPPAADALSPAVTVQKVGPSAVRPEIWARGEVRPRYRTVLSAELSGALVSISEQAHSGRRVAAGAVLMTLDDSRYLEAVARAKADLQAAELAAREEALLAGQARADWERLEAGGTPSTFLLREPQVRSAQLRVEAARATLREAETNLSRTVIKAPFNAAVVRRMASLGSYVEPGSELIELDSSDRFELRLPLAPRDWSLLPPDSELVRRRWRVRLSTGGPDPASWTGVVDRVERHVEVSTRQRSLVVRVDDPLGQDPPLHAGTFVRAALSGRELDRVLDLPAHAISDRGELWAVGADDSLEKWPVETWPAADGRVLVEAPASTPPGGLDVVLHPMASYVAGQTVRRRVVAGELPPEVTREPPHGLD